MPLSEPTPIELLWQAFGEAQRGNAGTVWADDIERTPSGRTLLNQAALAQPPAVTATGVEGRCAYPRCDGWVRDAGCHRPCSNGFCGNALCHPYTPPATPPAIAPAVEHPGEHHTFSIACDRCGKRGYINLSVIGPDERLTIAPISAPDASAP